MRLSLRSLLSVMTIAAFGLTSQAVDLQTPAGLNPGDTFRFIFLTTTGTGATSTSLDNYNTLVQNDVAGYTYAGQSFAAKAIGSTATVNARDNVGGFNTNVPVYLVTGTKVANDLTTNAGGLWSGSILTNIQRTISGSNPGFKFIWTGTLADGTASADNFSNNNGGVTFGWSSQTDGYWIADSMGVPITDSKRIYGLTAPLTVPVPEPSTWALGAIAASSLGYLARRRRKLAGK